MYIPCGPSCSIQPLSFNLVDTFAVENTGSMIFWEEIGVSWIIDVALKWIVGELIRVD